LSGLGDLLAGISAVDRSVEPEVRANLDRLTKPPGSLGRMEEFVVQYCCIAGVPRPVMGGKFIFTFAGDHGVAAEGVSAFPKEVTSQMVRNMLAGGAAVNVLAAHAGAESRVVDIGVDDPLDDAPGLIRRKVRAGTANIAEGPAMTALEALEALKVGFDLSTEAAKEGATLIGTGEMGIANTTPSSALYCALLPCLPEEIAGRGTGIDDAALARKIRVIGRSLEVNRKSLPDPLSALAALGGLEIAGNAGLILGAASSRIPVVVDGFISSAAALVACRLCEEVRGYLYFSHCSAEAGHKKFFEEFGETPILDLGLRLGEGTGAALAISLIDASLKIYNEMATFGSAGVSGEDS
jgi:nicotinate-nucleotide--dimethylbenzimidazole phosphoribosyltransferase